MSDPRQPDAGSTDEVSQAPSAVPTETPGMPSTKTLQELERLQFDQLDRAGFNR